MPRGVAKNQTETSFLVVSLGGLLGSEALRLTSHTSFVPWRMNRLMNHLSTDCNTSAKPSATWFERWEWKILLPHSWIVGSGRLSSVVTEWGTSCPLNDCNISSRDHSTRAIMITSVFRGPDKRTAWSVLEDKNRKLFATDHDMPFMIAWAKTSESGKLLEWCDGSAMMMLIAENSWSWYPVEAKHFKSIDLLGEWLLCPQVEI